MAQNERGSGIENIGFSGSKIGFHGVPAPTQRGTGVSEAVFVENAGGAVINVDSTAGGYTFQKVVQALQDMGLLA